MCRSVHPQGGTIRQQGADLEGVMLHRWPLPNSSRIGSADLCSVGGTTGRRAASKRGEAPRLAHCHRRQSSDHERLHRSGRDGPLNPIGFVVACGPEQNNAAAPCGCLHAMCHHGHRVREPRPPNAVRARLRDRRDCRPTLDGGICPKLCPEFADNGSPERRLDTGYRVARRVPCRVHRRRRTEPRARNVRRQPGSGLPGRDCPQPRGGSGASVGLVVG